MIVNDSSGIHHKKTATFFTLRSVYFQPSHNAFPSDMWLSIVVEPSLEIVEHSLVIGRSDWKSVDEGLGSVKLSLEPVDMSLVIGRSDLKVGVLLVG